jgi:lysozyme
MSDIPVCIDISHHQGTPDMREVAASGVLGLIHKATEGSSFIDDARAQNCSNAIAAGIAVSTYFWLKPGDGRSQAEFYLSVVDPVDGERVVIDYEEDGCSLTTLKDAVQALLDYGKNLQITVYSGHLLKEVLGDSHDAFLAEHTDLWLAQYTSMKAASAGLMAPIRSGRCGNTAKAAEYPASTTAMSISTVSTAATKTS